LDGEEREGGIYSAGEPSCCLCRRLYICMQPGGAQYSTWVMLGGPVVITTPGGLISLSRQVQYHRVGR